MWPGTCVDTPTPSGTSPTIVINALKVGLEEPSDLDGFSVKGEAAAHGSRLRSQAYWLSQDVTEMGWLQPRPCLQKLPAAGTSETRPTWTWPRVLGHQGRLGCGRWTKRLRPGVAEAAHRPPGDPPTFLEHGGAPK